MANFRTTFNRTIKPGSWFPLHMATGIHKIQRIIKQIDCVVEVHDARVPFSGRSSYFHQQIVGGRPHLLLLNKVDLIDLNFKTDVDQKLVHSCDRILYTASADRLKKKNLEKIVPELIDLLRSKHRFHREDTVDIHVLVVGIPNVGKSSLINALRKDFGKAGKPMAVAPHAGVTKTLSERLKISNSPPIYLVDTPGILEPELGIQESPFRLALCGSFNDHVVGYEAMVDYLLFWLNKRRLFRYVQALNLPNPIDNVEEVLLRVAMDKNFTYKGTDMKKNQKITRFDLTTAAKYIINLFRSGELGLYLLDDDILYQRRLSVKILPTMEAQM